MSATMYSHNFSLQCPLFGVNGERVIPFPVPNPVYYNEINNSFQNTNSPLNINNNVIPTYNDDNNPPSWVISQAKMQSRNSVNSDSYPLPEYMRGLKENFRTSVIKSQDFHHQSQSSSFSNPSFSQPTPSPMTSNLENRDLCYTPFLQFPNNTFYIQTPQPQHQPPPPQFQYQYSQINNNQQFNASPNHNSSPPQPHQQLQLPQLLHSSQSKQRSPPLHSSPQQIMHTSPPNSPPQQQQQQIINNNIIHNQQSINHNTSHVNYTGGAPTTILQINLQQEIRDILDSDLLNSTRCVINEEKKKPIQKFKFSSKYNFSPNQESKELFDITEYLTLPQSLAAKKLQIPASTLSKRWREASNNRKWPWRTVKKIDKEIQSLRKNVSLKLPEEIEANIATLMKKRDDELQTAIIRL